MGTFFFILLGKLVLLFSRALNLGTGSTWPGHIALELNPNFLRTIRRSFEGKIVLIAGTNGKTTTAKILRTILEQKGIRIIHNEAGANLLNGIASTFIQAADFMGTIVADVAIFEVDENTLPLAIDELSPDVVVLLNLFRDQLDRYGEVDVIANKWHSALQKLSQSTVLILNADDPHVAYLGKHLQNVQYFGIDDKKHFRKVPQHAMDTIYCPHCSAKLSFAGLYFSHLGIWHCPSCHLKRPKIDSVAAPSLLPGLYNEYNVRAALVAAKVLEVDKDTINSALQNFAPAFGRQEEFTIDGKKVKIFLSKNPTGFNESLRTVNELGAQYLLLVLNDRIPDGRDVSWIWDADVEDLDKKFKSITVSGDRTYDMALRLKYADLRLGRWQADPERSPAKSDLAGRSRGKNHDSFEMNGRKFQIEKNLKKAISSSLDKIPKSETLYILPTYSAMLEVRKILTGKKLL